MVVCAGAPPAARLDAVLSQRAFDPVRDFFAKSQKTGRTDPAFAKSRLQTNLVGSSDRAGVGLGHIHPFSADLRPFVQPRVPDSRVILAQLGIEGRSLSVPAAFEAEIRTHADLALDG